MNSCFPDAPLKVLCGSAKSPNGVALEDWHNEGVLFNSHLNPVVGLEIKEILNASPNLTLPDKVVDDLSALET